MIEKIEIQYFRSIYRISFTNVSSINILTGKNDVGKSNVLKALNLFFNNYIVEEGDYDFSRNYNLKRLEEVRKDTIKGKQFIQIKITFKRGKQYEKTLPESFTISKKWNRDSSIPQISDNIELMLRKKGKKCTARSKASLTRYLNGIKYVYVPAIKDYLIFDGMLRKLQNTVYNRKLSGNKKLSETMENLYKNVVETTKELSDEFQNATNVESVIATPKEVDELYRTLRIITKIAEGTVALEDRGDGIRVRYLPSILNYIAMNASESYIWGFEEPENSLEFNMARKMADDFYYVYKNNSTIFVTTHSPAFIDIGYKDEGMGYRCYKEQGMTQIINFNDAHKLISLEEELGYAYILKRQYDEYKELVRSNEIMCNYIEQLKTELLISKKPVLLTEGKTDAQILKIAWEKLYDYECPFDIKSCNLLDEKSKENAIAGTGILGKILCSVRYDSSKIIIGLFDNDKAGLQEFKLDANYKTVEDKVWKIHKNRKGYAFVIPADEELKKIADIKNLSIEYLFDIECLMKEVNGKKLIFDQGTVVTILNGNTIKTQIADDSYWYYLKIQDESKTDFAFDVVPTFEKEKFEKFKLIFGVVLDILEDIE